MKRAVKIDRKTEAVIKSLLRMYKAPSRLSKLHITKVGLSLAVALILLAMAPLAVALGVHHELAAVDLDGHQHSDFDLCQWIQQHASGSLILEVFDARALWQQRSSRIDPPSFLLTSDVLVSTSSPRGPPLS